MNSFEEFIPQVHEDELIEINERPWERYPRSEGRSFQCNCSTVRKRANAQKSNRTSITDGKPLLYQPRIKMELNQDLTKPFQFPDELFKGQFLKTVQIKYKFPLSLTAQSILTSFSNKYMYYAIDDILYLLDSNPTERDNILAVLYSSMLSLHNDLSINFFDIWIQSIFINENYSTNRFLTNKQENLNRTTETILTLKLHYITRVTVKKPEPIW